VLTVASGRFSVVRFLKCFYIFLTVRVLSSTLLPSFFGPLTIGTNRESATPCPLSSSSSHNRFGFIATTTAVGAREGGLPWAKRTTSPYHVRLHIGSIVAGYEDLISHGGLTFFPTIYKLFATCIDSASCFLQTLHLKEMPLPCHLGHSLNNSGCL
jgi:hypothetical protein